MLHTILRNLVEQSGKTQKEIATALCMSQQRFNFYVNGSREPDSATIGLIADYFGVSADYLLGRTDIKKASPSEDELAKLLQEPLMKDIYDATLRLSPEHRKLVLAQIAAVQDLEERAKK